MENRYKGRLTGRRQCETIALVADGSARLAAAALPAAAALLAAAATVFSVPAFARDAASAGFSGNACALLAASQIPQGVASACHEAKPDVSDPGKTTYVARWGSSGVHLEVNLSTFTGTAARNEDLANFKQETSILPQIGVPVEQVKIGSWAREYVTTKAVSVLFAAGGEDCIIFILNNVPKAADNAIYRAEALAIARAVEAKLT